MYAIFKLISFACRKLNAPPLPTDHIFGIVVPPDYTGRSADKNKDTSKKIVEISSWRSSSLHRSWRNNPLRRAGSVHQRSWQLEWSGPSPETPPQESQLPELSLFDEGLPTLWQGRSRFSLIEHQKNPFSPVFFNVLLSKSRMQKG